MSREDQTRRRCNPDSFSNSCYDDLNRLSTNRLAWLVRVLEVALHAELIRTLAYSVRRHSWHSRPFVVLTEVQV